MARSAHLFISSVVAALVASSVQAQQATPAEFPPTSFQGTQYVDSEGCAFIRAGRGALVNWVPRVDRARNQLCGFRPSLSGAATTISAPAGPIITFDDLPAPAAAPTQAAAPVAPAPAAPAATGPGAPIQTVASLFTLPQLLRPAAPASAPAPVAAPVAAPAPVAEPARPTITLAQACDGRFGIQTGFINGSTGDPIDCGPAPVAAVPAVAAPAPVVAPVRPSITLAQACEGVFGIQAGFISASTGDPIDCGPAPVAAAPILTAAVAAPVPVPAPEITTEPRRVTLDQICSEIAATGQTFINAATGAPVVCPTPELAPTILAAVTNTGPSAPGAPGGAVAPTAPAVNALSTSVSSTCEGYSLVSGRYFVGATGLPVRCGPQTQSPSGTQTTTRATALFAGPVVPASNPVGAAARAEPVRPPSGYDRVWGDGRLNPQRGLRRITPEQAAAAGITAGPATIGTTERISSRSVAPAAVRAPAATASHRYVQVASFGDHGNADRLAAQFRAKGWPVTFGTTSRGGQNIKVVILGPLNSGDMLRSGLGAARAAGFGDAFTRN